MTLPSRLHSRAGTRASLADTGAALNVNGTQNIARLQMSIGEDPVPNGESHDATRETGDSRLATHGGRLSEEDEEGGLAELDMDFFPVDALAMNGRGRRADRRLHTFGRVESSRSDQETGGNNDGDDLDGRDRARRRAAGLPIMHKFVSSSFLSSSFPGMNDQTNTPQNLNPPRLPPSYKLSTHLQPHLRRPQRTHLALNRHPRRSAYQESPNHRRASNRRRGARSAL